MTNSDNVKELSMFTIRGLCYLCLPLHEVNVGSGLLECTGCRKHPSPVITMHESMNRQNPGDN